MASDFEMMPQRLPTISFATACWERDWRKILLDPTYLRIQQIENHCYPFAERLLIINNVLDLPLVKRAAEAHIEEGTLTRVVVADEIAERMLAVFQLSRNDFLAEEKAQLPADWLYYNALAPLSAIFAAEGEYLLYLTGDVRLDSPLNWIPPSLRLMQRHPRIKVANPVWNERYKEAKRESYRTSWNFYWAKEGFSDQMFLVRRSDFFNPIYKEIRPDSSHFPRGDVFEKRVFSYMKNRGWERIIYKRGSYTHENIVT